MPRACAQQASRGHRARQARCAAGAERSEEPAAEEQPAKQPVQRDDGRQQAERVGAAAEREPGLHV